MNRAGQEPAADLKRRIAAACEEAGLAVVRAWARLCPDRKQRYILVAGTTGDQVSDKFPAIEVLAFMGTDGRWQERVKVYALAGDGAHPFCPARFDESLVALPSLIPSLREVLDERTKVLDLMKSGEKTPIHFPSAVWAQSHESLPAGSHNG